MHSAAEFLSAFRRCDQVYSAQLGPPEPLWCGAAYCAPAFADLPEANQVRDVLLGGRGCDESFETVEEHFAARQRVCRRWAISSEQPIEAVARQLGSRGWLRRDRAVFGLSAFPDATEHSASKSSVGELRILPARAMRRAYRATFVNADGSMGGPAHRESEADAAAERLDDTNYDVSVAIVDGLPAGRIGLLQTGDIARVEDAYVLPTHRRRGVGTALLQHVMQLAYRLRPRVVVAGFSTATGGNAASGLLTRFGFSEAGVLQEWDRP